MQHGSAIDRVHLDAQTFGDRALADELLGLFAGQCRSLSARICDAAASPAERADAAHTLKGSALGVGAGAVAETASRIEDGLRRGGPLEPAGLAALAAAVAAALAEIEGARRG